MENLLSYLRNSVDEIHQDFIKNLKSVKFKEVLQNQNFEFFRTIKLLTPGLIITRCIEQRLYKTEERLFKNWCKKIAVIVNHEAYSGWASKIQGIDLEFTLENDHYLIVIKSSLQGINRYQIGKMSANINSAIRFLLSSNPQSSIVPIIGCCEENNGCYEGDNFQVYSGEKFWQMISGKKNLYKEVIEPLFTKARLQNEEYSIQYANMINRFSREFFDAYCFQDGAIDWQKLVQVNNRKEVLRFNA